MKKSAFLFFFALLLTVQTISVYPQQTNLILENGVAAHKEIDAIYRQFSEAYQTLDFEKVTNLYSENAAYLPPDNDILKGRDQIGATFQTFFEQVKKEGRTMTISFRIVQRKVEKNLGYDVGVYTITQFKDGKNIGSGEGKFIVVAVKEKDGKWRFQVDGYNNLKPENKQEGVEKLTLDKEQVFTVCPWNDYSCTEDELNIKVETISQNAEKNKLNYYYTISGGKIIGQGANVIWDLTKSRPGSYTITASVGKNSKIRGETWTKTIEVQECPECHFTCECPTLTVISSKKTVYKSETFEFVANLNGGSQDEPTYKWTVENGAIIEGQGTTKIRVQVLSGEAATATVEIGGLCASCPPIQDFDSVKINK